ncbi:MAG: T9SS type A sorting domain-containing protein [Bacteroidetes bacterium]|nr:T9SS type A sorting domain-containing protein [Bacteroidota bacterium]
MKIKKITTAIFLSCIFLSDVFLYAQGNQMNLQKYWHYRYRLKNYFMVMGDGSGESLPATIRNIYGISSMQWSETPRYMGWYLGVLATEYKLLADNGQTSPSDLTNELTKQELYYALKAIERIDILAEVAYKKPYDPVANLNGFLIEDDVSPLFVQQHINELNKPIGVNPISTTWLNGSGEPAYVDKNTSLSVLAQNPASQDMIEELFIGFSLISKCVPNVSMTFHDNNGNLISDNLHQRALDEMDRILTYVAAFNDPQKNTWTIYDPDNNYTGNAQGGDLRAYSHGFAHAGNFIYLGKNYEGGGSEGVFEPLWQSAQTLGCTVRNNQNDHIALGLASICDCWNDFNASTPNQTKAGIKRQGDYDAHYFLAEGGEPCDWASNHYGFDLFYGALHRFLHNYDISEDPAISLCDIQTILDNAPWDGPYSHFETVEVPPNSGNFFCVQSTKDIAPNGWGSSLRFSVAPTPGNEAQINGDCGFRGNYNGLDYMLFHNLYYLLNGMPGQLVHGIYPLPGDDCDPGSGSQPLPYVVNTDKFVFVNGLLEKQLTETCSGGGYATYHGDVRIFGGQRGVTVMNTYVEYGSHFHISIDPNNCGVNPDIYVFDPSAYQRVNQNQNNNNNSTLPPYTMSEEFKKTSIIPAVLISPNPNHGFFTVQLLQDAAQAQGAKDRSASLTASITIYNDMVQEIYKSAISSNQSSIDLSSQPKGIYFVKVQSASKIYTEKVVIQ